MVPVIMLLVLTPRLVSNGHPASQLLLVLDLYAHLPVAASFQVVVGQLP
jgi:hypothetical protein